MIVSWLFDLLATQGQSSYFGEPVSQCEHALQTAYLAEQAGASDALVVAALLHDVGYLLHGGSERDTATDHHEIIGETWLSRYFGPEITEPVRLHVAAKRYLCAVEPEYGEELSPASQRSLPRQGGPFTPDEVATFASYPYHQDAVQLRRWDDLAKVPGWKVPRLEHYRQRVIAALLPEHRPS